MHLYMHTRFFRIRRTNLTHQRNVQLNPTPHDQLIPSKLYTFLFFPITSPAKATQPWWSKLVGGITAEAAAGGNGANAGRRQGTILPSGATSPKKVAPAPADIEAGSAEGAGEGRGAEVAKETDGEHRPAALSSSTATSTTTSATSSSGGANNRLPTSPYNDDSPLDNADGSESESKAETGRGAGNEKREQSPSEKAQAYSDSHTDFKDIFLGGRPQYFYWSVDVCIMFCCFYLAMWATNFISLTEAYPDARVMWHVILIGPVFLVLQLLAMINKTVSLLNAVCALDLKLTLCTIKDTLEMHETMREMRDFTLSKIRCVFVCSAFVFVPCVSCVFPSIQHVSL